MVTIRFPKKQSILNYLPDDGKRKKPSFSRQSPCLKHTCGGFEYIKAAVPYALDKGVTPIR